jgi:transcriptional regulator with XRE-family HTH domain
MTPLTKLIEWEHSNGYKAKFVAEKLGLSQSNYSAIKKGRIKPSLKMVDKLSKEFNMSIDDAIDLLRKETNND